MRHVDYYRPRSLEEALRLKAAHPAARFIAGGTDVMVQMRHHALRPSVLISLSAVPELRGVEVNGRVRIGAFTTISELLEHETLQERYPVLLEAARELGSVQIRNVATLGGNLCNASPCADTATPLLVLEARLRLASARGAREVPLHGLFVGPGQNCLGEGEILTHILLDPPPAGTRATFKKKGRVKMDLALASAAVLLQMEGQTCRRARVAAGSVAPVPLRLPAVEALLEGHTVTREVLAAVEQTASRSVSPISDVRATEAYRRAVVGVFVRRAVEELTAGERSAA
jgi:carbon-monoxide dehydrogenase medium subunit